jgi:hypothetical protein
MNGSSYWFDDLFEGYLLFGDTEKHHAGKPHHMLHSVQDSNPGLPEYDAELLISA